MATTAQHIAARADGDLQARFIAAAEQKGVPLAQNWVQAHFGQLISVDVDTVQPGTQNIADVHAYAVAHRQELIDALPPLPPPPGVDPAAVTDAQLYAAIDVLLTPDTPPTLPDLP
ncbi:MAG TPA: hypothetical protein VFU07_07070 [Candidatus Lumbricidophila sp.]|nr:hypothetical protein [Candidatus Lumbricidophila sp.]